MSLLHEIQASITQEGTDLGSIILKLRLLASRLGSGPLEEWIKHESEGYPQETELPSYRVIGVTYTGTFLGPFGSAINNAPIPPYLIEKFGGESWTKYEIRNSIVAVDKLVKSSADGSGTLCIDASNLILLLQGKVYEGYACNYIQGTVSRTSLVEIQNAVRSRILELTLELERSVPVAADISCGTPDSRANLNSDQVTQISQQIIYGNVTTIASSGQGAQFHLSIGERDDKALVEYLMKAGILGSDASELAAILASEEPSSNEEPFGVNAKAWLVENLKKVADGTWKVGFSVATKVLTEAALKYYGLK